MTKWETKFSKSELENWKNNVKDEDLKQRIEEMIICLGMCVSNSITVIVTQN